MRGNTIVKPLFAFCVACLVALPLTFWGLRWYFNEARLQESLTRSYSAADFQAVKGNAVADKGTLLVNAKKNGVSFVNVDKLHLNTRFYGALQVTFSEKDKKQFLSLYIKRVGEEQPVKRPIIVNSHFILDDFLPRNTLITDVGLITNKLTIPYRLESMIFLPRKLGSVDFAYLLIDCFAINKQWEDWSINTHKSPYQVLIPPKMLVLIYFTVVGLLFLVYLRLTKRPLINAWWATLVAAWFALDAHYLVEKTVITKNTYDTFAHLSDDEKDMVLSPEAAKIAQAIKSVLPDDGKRKKIRIQFGWNLINRKYYLSENRYLAGKLYYLMQPELIYPYWLQIPPKEWQVGGFYYVDTVNYLSYDVEQDELTTESGQKITVKRLANTEGVKIYYVLGAEPLSEGNK